MSRPAIWDKRHAAAFEDAEVARLYRHRPPFAAAAIGKLSSLCVRPRTVLDLGAGTGFIARRLAPLVDRVDALDVSAAMLAEGRARDGGEDERLVWIVGTAEEAPLRGAYGLVAAGDSLHWMDWDVVLPRIGRVLAPGAFFAIVEITEDAGARVTPIRDLIVRYSIYGANYQPIDLLNELDARGLFHRAGAEVFRERFTQSRDSFVASFHARASLSIARIGVDRAAEFDRALARIVDADPDRYLSREITTTITWGRPA